MPVFIEDPKLLEFLEVRRSYPVFPSGIVSMGSGPFHEVDFDLFLDACGIKVFSVFSSNPCDTLVLGRSAWDPAELDEYIERLRGKRLRVYSQEMLLSYLESNDDPFEDPDRLRKFGRGHPALEHLLMWGFQWPTTDVVPGIRNADAAGSKPWPHLGLLQHMGYGVGHNGESVRKRHNILRQVFTDLVPNVHSPEYMAEWGTPGSKLRLKKLANTIAALARNAKRKEYPPQEAIRDWEKDLAWLKAEFYDGTFPWPFTKV